MWEKEIFIRHFSDKEDRISGGLKKSHPDFMFAKGLHFSEDFGRRDFYNGVGEGFFWKTTDLVS